MVRVNATEVDCGDDEVASGFGSGFELGENIGWVNEERRDGGNAGVDKAFNSDLGFVELLYFFHSVVFFVVNVGCHDFSLSFSLQLLRAVFFFFLCDVCVKSSFYEEERGGKTKVMAPDQPHNFERCLRNYLGSLYLEHSRQKMLNIGLTPFSLCT